MKRLCTLICLLALSFNYCLAELEPQDNFFKTGEVIALPYNSTGHIATVGDKDIMKVTTTTGGMLVVDITNVPANLEMQVFAYGVNDTVVNIGNVTGGSGAAVKLKVNVPAGTYYILVNDQNNNDNNAAAFTIQIALDQVDAGEWNNTFKAATPVSQNDTFQARLDGVYLPLPIDNDRDYYKFTTTGGLVTIKVTNVPSALEIQLYAFSATDSVNSIGYVTGGSGANTTLQLSLPAGSYVFRINDQYDNDLDGTPFTVQINLDKDEACEWNNLFAYACTVPENTTFQARISGFYIPLPYDNDRDYYKVNTTSGGVFSINITKVPANLELQISVYLASDSTKLVGSVTGTQGQNTRLDVVVPQGSYTIRINDQYDNEVSDSLYTVKFSLDHTDGCEWNNFFKAACTINENSSFPAAIRGYNLLMPIDDDRDYYKVVTTGGGVLTINIPKPPANLEMEIFVYLASDSTKLVGNITGTQGQPTTLEVVIPQGSYYIRINDQYDNELSDSTYTVNVNLNHSDACEWNNFFAAACTVGENDTFTAALRGYNLLMPVDDDRDFYKINTTQGGVLIFTIDSVPANLEMQIYGFGAKDTVNTIGAVTGGSGATTTLELVIPAGTYYIRVSDQYDNDLNAKLYNVRIHLDVDDACEWNNTFATACTKGVNDTFQAKLRGIYLPSNPDNDRDYYKISSPLCGTLKISVYNVPTNIQIQITLLDGNDSTKTVASVTGGTGFTITLTQAVGIKNYYFRINDQYDNALSPNAFTVALNLSNTNPITPTITLTGPPALCNGDSVFLISSGVNHHWTTGDTTVSIIVKTGGTYIDTVYGAPGCYAASSPVVISSVPPVSANFGFTSAGLSYNFSDSSQHATTYSWDFGDGGTSTSTNPQHTYALSGAYTVTLIVTNACGSDTIQKVVNLSTDIALAKQVDTFYILPNPCNTCEINGMINPEDMKVMDVTGRILSAGFTKTSVGYLLVLPDNAKGLLIIRNERTGEVRKFIRE